jgi:hypothetical protein
VREGAAPGGGRGRRLASKRQLELMDQLGKLDAYITEARAKLDDAARGRRFKDVAATAEELAKRAKLAAELQGELDKLLTEAWEKRRA